MRSWVLSKAQRLASHSTRRSNGAGSIFSSRVREVRDSGIVGGAVRITQCVPPLVDRHRRPHNGDPDLAGLDGVVRLVVAALDLCLPRRHSGAVWAEIEGGGIGRLGFDDAAFVAGDLMPAPFGVRPRAGARIAKDC